MLLFKHSSTCVLLGASLFWVGSSQLALRAQDADRGAVYTKRDIGEIVESLAGRTESFKHEFDRAVEHSLLDGTKLEDRAKHRADDLHDAAKRLRDVYHDKRDKESRQVRDEVDRTLGAASDVNRIMDNHRFTERVQHEWDVLRSDLNGLADAYGLSPL